MSIDLSGAAKFKGHYVELTPVGSTHIHFKKNDMHYSWKQENVYANGILVAKLWVSFEGEYTMVNHKTQETCVMKYHSPPSLFSKEGYHRVTCLIKDASGMVRYVIDGTFNKSLECFTVLNPKSIASFNQLNELNLDQPKLIWSRTNSQ